MEFLLQIIYLDESLLKLFTLWISFYTTRRFSVGRIPRNGLGSGGLSGATTRGGLSGVTTRGGLLGTLTFRSYCAMFLK